MSTLANHPGLFRRWVVFANHFLFKSTLTVRAREILILRSGWLAGCAYEWGQHAKIATADAECGKAEFAALAEGASSRLWAPAEAALLRAADAVFLGAFVDDVTWQVLVAHYDERQILDVIFMVSNDLTLAMGLNAFGVQLDEGYRGFLPGLPTNDRRPSTTRPPMGARHGAAGTDVRFRAHPGTAGTARQGARPSALGRRAGHRHPASRPHAPLAALLQPRAPQVNRAGA